MSQSISGINEFVLRFANVNGTGSASANAMVAKALFRCGLPIGAKNMFPSNIQGLPTWYEVRVSERGYTGRRGGVDLVVAMNPQTFARDTVELNAGGYMLYDSTRYLAQDQQRKDITYLPIPFTDLTRERFANPKVRPMLKNVVYVGALSALLGINIEIFRKLIQQQFAKKPKLIPDNEAALELGYAYAREHFTCPLGIRIEERDLVKGKILIGGNDAAGLGCVFAGATVAGWYPITPSTSLVEAFQKYCNKFRKNSDGTNKFAIIQAEDEIAAIGMVIGASWNGARAFTATSGPGISLMSEFLGYAYYAEIPTVLFNVQRCGPSTGMPTRNQQADLLLCAYASHGDTKHLLLFPSDPKECFEFAIQAFDLAETYQTPVLVMSDLELGMNEYVCDQLEWFDNYEWQRGKVMDVARLKATGKPFYRYLDSDNDGIPYRSYPGVDGSLAYFTRGSGHDKFGRYTEDGALYQENMLRIVKKFSTAANQSLPEPVTTKRPGARDDVIVISYGTTLEPLHEALDLLAADGLPLNDLRVRSFPFSDDFVKTIKTFKRIVVVEQNRDGQLRQLLQIELSLSHNPFEAIVAWDGMPAMALDLAARIGFLIRDGGSSK